MVYKVHAMASSQRPTRDDLRKLGLLLREARRKSDSRHYSLTPEEIARQLGVSRGFVYQVEQGKRKPKSSELAQWATVYGVSHLDVYKCLGQVPMDMVASLKTEARAKHPDVDPFDKLTEQEKRELLPFLEYVHWKSSGKSLLERRRH
jgi:transcriptional regulator with XRE-family HTH domain